MENSGKYIIAIDGGTQSTKVVIFNLAGQIICNYSVKLKPLNLFQDGRAEHPKDDLWQSLIEACQGLMSKFNGNLRDIIGIGLGSIRCCRALLRHDGTLAAPIQNWMDQRLSKPYVNTDDTVAYVTTATGYLTHRLTGAKKDTRANYVGQWPIDPETLEWDVQKKSPTDALISEEKLFDLVDQATILGTVSELASKTTGLPKGLPVISTSNDKAVEALGAGLSDDGAVLISLGTYITAMMYGQPAEGISESHFINPGPLPGEFLHESNGIRRGMSTITWITDLMGKDLIKNASDLDLSPENYLSQIASHNVPPGSDGLYTVLNWLARPGHSYERGLMMGFMGHHKGPHMFRSILEGMAMTMKNHTDAMCREMRVDPNRIIISGGGSNSDLTMQIFADVFGIPAQRNFVNGSASLGAAICTALALNIYRTREEAISNMVTRKDEFKPIPKNTHLYREINDKVYRDLSDRLTAPLLASQKIFDPERAL